MQNLLTSDSEDPTTWFTPGGSVTVTGNAALNPRGNANNAGRVEWTAGATRYCSPSGQVFKKGVYTISMWVRAVSGTQLFQMRLPLVPGVSNQDSGNYTATTVWQRFSFTAYVGGEGTFTSVYFINDNVSATDVYVWGMQLSQTASACEYVRSTTLAVNDNAPRGFLCDYGAGFSCENFFLQSEDLSTSWTGSAASAGTGTDYDGNTTNCAIVEDGTNAGHYVIQTPSARAAKDRIMVASCFAKAGTRNYLGIAPAGAGVQVTFDLTTGVGTFNQGSGVNAGIRPGFGAIQLANGWWFCYVIYRQDVSATSVRFYAGNSTTAAAAYLGTNGNKAIYITRMQLAASMGPTNYTKTTTQYALGRSQRGMPLQSLTATYINDASWAWTGVNNVTADPTPTPWGTTAYRLIENGANSAHAVQATGANYVTGRVQSMRVRLKAGTRTWAIVGIGGGGIAAWINLSTGAFGTTNGFIDKDIKPLGDGWYEVILSAVTPNAGGPTVYATSADGVAVYVGDNASYVLVAETQMTEGRSTASIFQSKHYGRAPRGLMRTWNLCKSSQNMHGDTTNWVAIGSVVRAASSFPAPDGTNTASNLNDSSAAEYRGVYQAVTVPKDRRSYVFSVYVRGGSTTPVFGINFQIGGGTVVAMSLRVDPSTGQYTNGTLRSSAEKVIAADGSTWYRVWCVLRNNGTNNTIQANLYAATSTSIGAGDTVAGTGNVDLWGAMIHEGEGPIDYIATGTTAVNLPGTPQRKMIEQERLITPINLSGFSGTGLFAPTSDVATPNGITSYRLREDATAASAHVAQTTLQVLRKGQIIYMSCIAKVGVGRTWLALGGNSGNSTSWFDIQNGVLGNKGALLYGDPIIRPLGNGWFFCGQAYFLDTTTPLVNLYLSNANGSAVYNGDGASYMLIADPQVSYSKGPPSIPSRYPYAQSVAQGRSPRGLVLC